MSPKGIKTSDAAPPPIAGCDFCGRSFIPSKWNQRTCVACAAEGAPDQSAMDWDSYVAAARKFRGVVKKPLAGAALWSTRRAERANQRQGEADRGNS